MAKPFKFNATPVASAVQDSTNYVEVIRIRYYTDDDNSGMSHFRDPLRELRCAAKALPLVVSCTSLSSIPGSAFQLRWDVAGAICLLVQCDAKEAFIRGDQVLLEELHTMCAELTRLQRFAELPSAQFVSSDWLMSIGANRLEWLARVYQLSLTLQRTGGMLVADDQPVRFPLIGFPTTKLLPSELQLTARKVVLNLDHQSGQLNIQLPSGGERIVPFKCPDARVFSALVASTGQAVATCQPVVDLLSKEELQLHSIQVLSIG